MMRLARIFVLSTAIFGAVSAANAEDGFLGGVQFGRNADHWELRGGAGAYDVGPFSVQSFNGVTLNAEVLAPSPDFLSGIGSPRPYLGMDLAFSDHEIHAFYGGVNWEAYWTQRFYTGFSVGGAFVSDQTKTNDLGEQKDLGSKVLFHLQASVGFDITPNWTTQVYLNHFSNANLADSNDGLESFGFRIGYRF
ncbi:acyloxyacyl hydrolase [Limoniibacter endophyticus]|nr:acyloxyacyl hydrolase [Limoniibacter endophyticus]